MFVNGPKSDFGEEYLGVFNHEIVHVSISCYFLKDMFRNKVLDMSNFMMLLYTKIRKACLGVSTGGEGVIRVFLS